MIHVAADKLRLNSKLRASGDWQHFPAVHITYYYNTYWDSHTEKPQSKFSFEPM